MRIRVALASFLMITSAAFAQKAATATPAPAPGPESGAMGSLDNSKLAQELSGMKMTELLAELVRQNQQATDPKSLWIVAQADMGLADQETKDVARHEALLKAAEDVLARLMDASKELTGDQEQVDRLRYTYTYVDLVGRRRCGLHAEEIYMLMGGLDDRAMLLEHTSKVLAPRKGEGGRDMPCLLDDLAERVNSIKVGRGGQWEVLYLSDVQDLQRELKYTEVWVRFYRALGLNENDKNQGKEKKDLLNDAIRLAEPFASGDNDEGIVYVDCVMLQGIACTELGKMGEQDAFAKAGQILDKAKTTKDVSLRMLQQLAFQNVRNLIEWGKFDDAKKGIEALIKMVPANEAQIADVQSAILLNHLYTKWSVADKANAAKYAALAAGALVDVIKKYSGSGDDSKATRAAFIHLVAEKYREQAEDPSMPSLVSYAVGMDAFDQAGDKNKAQAERKKAEDKSYALLTKAANAADLDEDLKKEAKAKIGWLDVQKGRGIEAAPKLFDGTLIGAQNAVIGIKQAIEAGNYGKYGEVGARNLFIEYLSKLLDNKEWMAADAKLNIWYIDLADQYRELAKGQADRGALDTLNKAVAAYEKVPSTDPKMKLWAEHLKLTLRYQILDTNKDMNASKDVMATLAKQYIDDLNKYVETVKKTLPSYAEDKAFSQDLNEWSSDSECIAAEILYEVLDEKAEGMRRLHELPQKYPGTRVLLIAKEYEIRKLIEQQQTDKAVQEIGIFQNEHPEHAGPLMQMVITQLRTQIEVLKQKPGDDAAKKLADTRQTYLKFAGDLMKIGSKAPDAQYSFKQMYADALVETGEPGKALSLFRELGQYEDKKIAEHGAQIDAKIKDLRAQLAPAKADLARLQKLATEFPDLQIIRDNRLTVATRDYAQALSISLDLSKKAADDADKKFRTEVLYSRLDEAYSALGSDLKATLPKDPTNIRGLARCLRAANNFDEALKQYKQLADGFNKVRYPKDYWQAELEYDQCALDALKDQKKEMGRLARRIDDFRQTSDDPNQTLSYLKIPKDLRVEFDRVYNAALAASK